MPSIRHRNGWALLAALLTASILATQPRQCPADWVNCKQFPPFDVWVEFPLSEAQGLLGELAQLQRDLSRDLGLPQAQQAIVVYLFRDQRSYASYLKQYLPTVPYRRALFVKSQGQGKVFTYRSRELPVDLRHECTHALLHAVLPMVPLWLDEGLAEYYEVPASQRSYDNPHLGTLRWNLLLGAIPKLESLEKKSDLSDMNRADYRYSWAWVHFMLHGPKEAKEELYWFLRDIWAGTPPGLLSQRLEQRLPKPGKRVAKHLKGWKRDSWFSAFR